MDNSILEETFNRTGASIMFGDVDPDKVGLSLQEAIPSPLVTHLRYGLSKKGD